MELEELAPSMSAVLPTTRYFEVTSDAVGARFAVWVTPPTRYDAEPEATYPVIYQPDGNLATPLTAPTVWALRDDPINPIEPFIQVSVGYVGLEATRMLAVRARDLLPPGEPLPADINEETMDNLVRAGLLDAEGAKLYLHNLRNPAADNFLTFLTDELHPLIAAKFRVDEDALGLFGHSYGGLFATYAALHRTKFRRIGAGSPGIIASRSKVFDLYDAELSSGADYNARMLHMTVCEKELTTPSVYQPEVAAGTAEFITRAGQTPLSGLNFSSALIPDESHVTSNAASWFSFLRRCYCSAAPTPYLQSTS